MTSDQRKRNIDNGAAAPIGWRSYRPAAADVSDRTQIELTGSDRKSFLHNMSTNEINGLPTGAGCEAFLTTAQGKILGHVSVFQTPDSIVLETAPGATDLIDHLDRYLIREDVELHDRSEAWGQLLLAGPQAVELLAPLVTGQLPERPLDNTSAMLLGTELSIRRTTMAGPIGFLLSCPRSQRQTILDAILQAGAEPVEADVLEAMRIEAGWPTYGLDITSDNLPQEVARNAQAISFTKGCYIGQETVARIDALGHVNKYLVGLRCETSEIPSPGTELTQDDKPVGQITSAAYSSHLESPIALGYVRRGIHSPETRLDSPLGPIEVIALPIQHTKS